MKRTVAALTAGVSLVAGACSGSGGGGTPPRTIVITATDALKWDPATVTGKAGERVRFEIRNPGTVKHEFVVGDAHYQADHERAMAASGGGHDHGGGDGGKAVDLPPGQTVRLDFTLPAQPPTYVCHVDGHDDAGMIGRVEYR